MPKQPQPVEPIFQPEIAADAILWSATHKRRELWVGFPVIKAIVGTRLLPGLGDRILASEAWEGQMTDEPLPADRHDNLHAPAPGDRGAHGRFDERAKSVSWHYRYTIRRGWALSAIAILLLLIGWAVAE